MMGGCGRAPLALLVAVLLIGAVGTGCSDREKFELRVRLREHFTLAEPLPSCFLDIVVLPVTDELPGGPAQPCSFRADEHVWSGDDGSRAVVTTHAMSVFVTVTASSTVQCGGRPIPGAWWVRLHPERLRHGDEINVQTTDGSALELVPKAGLWATTPRTTDRCFELSGTWRGVSGNLRGHTGTYTMVDDSIQTLLELIED